MARVTFLGLNMDVITQGQIVAAIRGLYPNLIQPTDSDNRAMQLVLKYIIAQHLAAWASRTALPQSQSVDDIANAARQQAVDAQNAAATQASDTADADIQPTATT